MDNKRRTKLSICLGLVLVISMAFASCTPAPAPTAAPAGDATAPPPAATGGDITIPFMGPLTGPDGPDGQGAAKAGQLAVDQANEAGGICGGRKLVYKTFDTKADPKEGANIASLLVNDASVYVVLSDYNSSVFLASKPIFNEAKLPALSYYTSAPNITLDGPYSYRIYPPADNMVKFYVDLLNKQGIKKIAMFYENEDYGQQQSKLTTEEAEKNGMTVVASEPVLKDQTDVSAPVSKIKDAGPEAIVAWVQYTVGAYFMKQSKDIGLDVPVYGHDGLFAPDFIRLAGPAAEGVYTAGSYDVDSADPVVSGFVTAFRDANNGENPNNPAGYTYDAATIVINALKETDCAGREAIKTWMDANLIGKTVKGVTGNILLDENRDRSFAPGMYTLMVVKDGAFVAAP